MSIQPAYTIPLSIPHPPDHRLHTESTTTIFLPNEGAFLNPVQHFNRDMSVAVIRSWNTMRKEEAEAKFKARLERRGGKPKTKRRRHTAKKRESAEITQESSEREEDGKTDQEGGTESKDEVPVVEDVAAEIADEVPCASTSTSGISKFRPPSINILEALAATGLRSIRYAKEIPNVKYVLANDLSPSACEAMRRNIDFNGVGLDYPPSDKAEVVTVSTKDELKNGYSGMTNNEESSSRGEVNGTEKTNGEIREELKDEVGRRPGCRGRVKINEGDACAFMYSYRSAVGPTSRVDVVDLDPYGTAAPFIDAAIGCIADGGLLAITCTDLAVLAGQQYPEKCFSNYGGTNVHAEFTHEAALRLVYHSLAQVAARYGRYITPLLSFSIDFYVRLFVRIHTGPEQVKKLASQTGVVYTCQYCQTPVTQPFGKMAIKETAKGKVMDSFKTVAGPTASNGSQCVECGGTMHLGGPLWLGPLQDNEFAKRVLKDIEETEKEYKTYNRMHGMLTLTSQELPDPWFFTANRIAKSLHTSSLPLPKILSALLNAGYKISRSHCAPGAIKTDAPRSFLYDMMRVEAHKEGVRLDKIAEGSPARKILAKKLTHEVDFTPHPGASLERQGKETFYQMNPTPNWGPAPRAKSVMMGEKRKMDDGLIMEVEEVEGKKQRVNGGDEEDAMNAEI
ncbi:N2,N2-dimethylguanosine tRNA methyltransferase [Cryptococcus depauperatus CBS 7841]|uniref:tRNA (guanine(26)-N(2))-dimethyltransferase n=1 Tax=Cryptococcus depauperatus CBS 7841 TaxID=1295531 RepID=A0A1E3I1L7_9TREE|nr:N2,N2-dimethylguanosine tRNA methyltransferase [Cryptococcus depauperatus CBS 7841]